MGKNKIDQLLTQLKDNHTEDIQNAAAIFTVAQGAVNQLKEGISPLNNEAVAALFGDDSTNAPEPPKQLTKANLIEKYNSYNGCRSAAKHAGIVFSKTPRWTQIVAAFNYLEACQNCVSLYMKDNPCSVLKGVSITLSLDP